MNIQKSKKISKALRLTLILKRSWEGMRFGLIVVGTQKNVVGNHDTLRCMYSSRVWGHLTLHPVDTCCRLPWNLCRVI